MIGTAVGIRTDDAGKAYRQQTASELFVADSSGEAGETEPLFCLKTQTWGKLEQGVWEEGWHHRLRWFSLDEFLKRWGAMEIDLNLLSWNEEVGEFCVPRANTNGTLNEDALRSLAAVEGRAHKAAR